MSITNWLRNSHSARARVRTAGNRRRSGPRPAATRCRLELETLEDRHLLAAGDLDPTFGGDGIVITQIGSRAQAHDLAILPDGRLVAVGHSFKTVSGVSIMDAALAQYLPTGALDPTFSGDGIVTTDFKRSDDWFNAVVVQADGKIVAGGGAGGPLALARYNVDGSLDVSFGGAKAKGKIVTDLSLKSANIVDLVLQTDGKILAVGGVSPSTTDVMLARYLNNGTLDKSFGTNGVRVLDLGGFESAQNVVLQPDGKIVIAGVTDTNGSRDFLLARFNSNGSSDTSFGTAGIVKTDIVSGGISLDDAAYILALQSDGKLVVAGKTDGRLSLGRYNANGTLDTTFGDDRNADGIRDGLVVTGMADDNTPSMAIDPNGRIVAATGGWAINVGRFLPDGSVDSTFGSNGVTSTDITAGYDGQGAVALDGNGKIVVAGYSDIFGADNPNKGFVLVRYQGDSPLQAASAAPIPTGALLTYAQLQPLLLEATARWSAMGVDASKLASLSVQIIDLPGNLLGIASGNTVYVDANAAGWGWFVDPTPSSDLEFGAGGGWWVAGPYQPEA